MAKVKIKGQPGFLKDTVTGAIINTNVREKESYQSKQAAMAAKSRSVNSEARIDKLENDINEIKELLLKVLRDANN